MEKKEKIRILENSLERNLSWISKANSIANFQFSLETAMLGALVLIAPFDVPWPLLTITMTIVSFLFLIICIAFGSMVYFPRTEGSDGSLIFFGGISSFDLNDFSEKMKELKTDDYIFDLLHQTHRNAEIANIKYRWVKRGMIMLYVSLIPWLVSIYWLSQIKPPTQ